MSAEWSWPGPDGGDDVEYSDPREEYSAIDARAMFIPAGKVHIRKCDDCGADFANKAFLHEHIRKAHAHEPEPRPESIPKAIAPERVRPEPEAVQPQPKPQAVTPERVRAMPRAATRKRGAPRSVPSTRRNTTRGK